MKLEPKTFSSYGEASELISTLQSRQITREIKLKRGSFTSGDIIDVEFMKNGERWRLYGVMDARGGVTLSRVS